MEETARSQPLPTFEFTNVLKNTWRHTLVKLVMQWAHLTAQENLLDVEVILLSEPDKLPYLLQAKAKKDFARGELVLVPFGGELYCEQDVKDGKTKFCQPDEKVLHPSLPASVAYTSWSVAKTANRVKHSGPSWPEVRFFMHSPLLEGKAQKYRKTVYENLAPFWAVGRRGRAKGPDGFSMVYESVTIELPTPKLVGNSKFPADSHKWFAKMQVLRNSKKLAKGDLLSLPFYLGPLRILSQG